MASTIKHIDSIHVLHELAGASPPNHPLFSIWKLEDLPKITQANFPELMTYGFYSSGLKKNLKGYVKYGRTAYDFQEGALGFKSPLQLLSFNPEIVAHATGWILFFHKDFIAGTKLAERIQGYNFFGYETNEGLHLSKTEEDVINTIYENIYMEYRRPIDKHSKQVMLSNLELLLTYAQRYYSRQFILRNESDSSALQGFEKVLNAFFEDRPPEINGLPTVEYFA
ncbi:MAG: AraC family transcriptional regulator, partial [Bacteroidota bacterium]